MSTFSHIITMDDTPPSGSGRALGQLTLQTDNSNSGYISARIRNGGEFRLFHYEDAYVTCQEQLSTNASQPYLQEGNYWHYFLKRPTTRRSISDTTSPPISRTPSPSRSTGRG